MVVFRNISYGSVRRRAGLNRNVGLKSTCLLRDTRARRGPEPEGSARVLGGLGGRGYSRGNQPTAPETSPKAVE